MTLYDEINALMEELIDRWGIVCIVCDGKVCTVSDDVERNVFEAESLIDALRKAIKAGV